MTAIKDKWQSPCGTVTLYLGDCLSILPGLEAGSVGAVVTDPPYGIGFDRATWADNPDEYASFMRQWIAEAVRIVNEGPLFVWQALLNAPRWHEWFPSDFRIFAACKGFVQYRPTPIQWSWDPVVYWGKVAGKPSVYRKDFHVQNLAPFGAFRKRIDHPSPRPLEQVEYIVRLASLQDTTILDPFMGSATTGVACIRTGRRFIGCEIDPGYFAIARDRCIAELNRHPLFDQPNPTQTTLFTDSTHG
jgi:DNA modification methylase